MNVLIDYTQVPVQKVGVGIYAYNLILNIAKLDSDNKYFVVMQDDDRSFDELNADNFTIIKVKAFFFRIFPIRVFLEQFIIPVLTIIHRIDVVHSLHYSFPIICFAKRVITIHDMTFFVCPGKHIFIKIYYFRLFIYLSSILGHKLIMASKSTQNDFLNKFNIDKNKTFVIYHGKDDRFKPGLPKNAINAIKNKYCITKDYFLYLGTLEPRKNLINLILAFKKFLEETKKTYQLVIAGKKGWHFTEIFKTVEGLKLENNVIFTGFFKESEKPILIAGAKIFIYPSLYEGFGIPVLEALACGIPVITSNISSLPEVAGDSSLLIDPTNVNDLFENIVKIIDDEKLYQVLKQKSIKQASNFNWGKAALETVDVYSSCY